MITRRRAWIVLAALGLSAAVIMQLPLPAVLSHGHGAVIISDARGALLREPPGDDGLRAEWTRLHDVPPMALQALIHGEDHRIGSHPGVDPWALLRAAWLDLSHGRVVSGGSTLAMQLARLSYDLPRSASGKLAQLLLAPYLTARLGSEGVLEAYVNLAPFGRDVRGFALASRAFFDKPLRDLTLAELVTLACLPRGPSLYDPYRHPQRLLARRSHVLDLMVKRGVLSARDADLARNEALHLAPFRRTFRAPHASDVALAQARSLVGPYPSRVRTTLVPELQRAAQEACKDAVAELETRAATGCAAVVLRVSTAEVLALVGSPDFHSPTAGQVNAARALRQPGSALKPFIYALAFARGRSPGSPIDDLPSEFAAPFGRWRPRNYDDRFHGTITLREALANSYNIPAVKLAAELGVADVVQTLSDLGLDSLRGGAQRFGVGIALGDGEVTLYDLVAAYATLSRGGEYLEPTLLSSVTLGADAVTPPARMRRRVFSPEVSYLVGHVLQDRVARRSSFGELSALELPFAAAAKTGTSSDYRDNWTLGYAGDVAVGVWVGRHDGAPMHGVSGVSGAAPAFRRIMMVALGKSAGEWPAPPAGVTRVQVGARCDLALAATSRFPACGASVSAQR